MISSPSVLFYLWSLLRIVPDILLGRLIPLRPSQEDLSGKTAIVTGANIGIGYEIASALASRGANVVLVCRNKAKAEGARERILRRLEGEGRLKGNQQVEVRLMDCGDLESVKKFVEMWGDREVDILINNAGMSAGTFNKSPQGFEQTYATNMLSHYLLTLSLLPLLTPGARIVNVSSFFSYGVPSQFDVNDLDYSKALEDRLHYNIGDALGGYRTIALYSRTKLLQIYFTRELQARLEENETYGPKGISVYAYHPGLVRSTIWSRKTGISISDWLHNFYINFINFVGILPEQGAATAVHLATSTRPEVRQNAGHYWERMGLRAPSRFVEDDKTRSTVWKQMAEEADVPASLRL